MITIKDIQGLIAAFITYQKQAFIAAMNASGYPVPSNISDDDLLDSAYKVLASKGADGIRSVLNKLRVNWNLYPENVKQKMFSTFGDVNQKCGLAHPLDCFTGAINWAGDMLGGHGTTITNPVTQEQTSESQLPTWVIIATVVLGLTGIMIFRKFAVVVVAIIVIVSGIFLYGIFVKKTSTTISGGGSSTETHGGLGAVLFSWLGL